ncbi:carbohydrate binding domain-containing protein [Enterococcus ratti]|uniref:Sugar-binding protein n=1 Tax=Enterococcus ratti TaxID=150033 RepID=A0A1L8WPS5_9ENTE|nr:carbohydrate binding domain-containing protein [Enterococcus ratti]OJG83024.1 sugar-binding protein [Enterococcus ratti]
MKRITLGKWVTVSIVYMFLGTSVNVGAIEIMNQTDVLNNLVNPHVFKEPIIKNGDFSSGLDYWIVSNPGSNNPKLITEDGERYVKSTDGESIHQILKLKPNTQYIFSYEVAASAIYPGKVELGTLNYGELFHPLKEVFHNNEYGWEKYVFTFSTHQIEDTYAIRFASTGFGWATFKNIDAQKNTLLSVGVKDQQPLVYLNLSKEQFYSKERFIVYVDGQYWFETYSGHAYYAAKKSEEEDRIRVYKAFDGKQGSKIEVYTASGIPGDFVTDPKLLETYIVEKDLV